MSIILANLSLSAKDHALPMSPEECLKCHEEHVTAQKYFQSSHKDLSCTACHIKTDDATHLGTNKLTQQCVATFKTTDCSSCHGKISAEYKSSVHNSQRLPITCSECHADIHEVQSIKNNKIAIANKCSQCHSKQKNYFESQHFKGLEKGHTDSATCTDCHGLHNILSVDNESKGRVFHTNACLQCHADKEKMLKNEVTAIAASSYFNSFHGKNVKLGYPEKVAGCADCHTAHSVLKADDANSSIHKNNVVKTCIQCHSHATASFTQYISHAEDHNREKFPALYWTRISMTGLLISTFLFFWIHSILWAFRAFIERHQQRKKATINNLATKQHTLADGHKIYRRFRPIHIVLHIFVVISFLGLSLTGLPLKFSSTSWGKLIFDFIGGAERARMIHHACAAITFFYFFVTLVMSAKYLFIDKKQTGSFLEKLFGPDSLFFNRRDLNDMQKMFKWFFFMGPKPTFERWTYWEKFDFLAVFWGMFAIGSSGLMLWFPEFFGLFLPGWMFNIATIIHSDEALLATGFIFTVHFFNTHFRPEKFPMDFVIFNGEITKQEMLEERADQWKRYENEGRTKEFEVHKPSSALWDFTLRIFGFIAVVIGISLVIGMISATLF
ncbi:MAG: cytochrome C [Bdellovibrio sp. 28-41-41]|nr:MAG: cytochrome C [Bdellovibrio sp. 28-41-41]